MILFSFFSLTIFFIEKEDVEKLKKIKSEEEFLSFLKNKHLRIVSMKKNGKLFLYLKKY